MDKRVRLVGLFGCLGVGGRLVDRHGEQLTRPGDIDGAMAVGEQAVMADAMESLGKNVHQKAADELVGGQGHGGVAGWTVEAVILSLEGHRAVVGGDEPSIGDGDAVGVTREVG